MNESYFTDPIVLWFFILLLMCSQVKKFDLNLLLTYWQVFSNTGTYTFMCWELAVSM